MNIYPDKFHMTPEQSLFLAKKKWDENVYCGMRMENRTVTFPQAKTILQGVNVPSVQLTDIQAILNMRDVWQFLLGSIDEPINPEYFCKLNDYIARGEAPEWGKLRTVSAMISGTDYCLLYRQLRQYPLNYQKMLTDNITVTAKALYKIITTSSLTDEFQ